MTYEEFRSSTFLPSLDGLRAIAVALVILVHYGGQTGHDVAGWLGVQMFFVLSGFLITTLLLRENDENGSISLGRFYTRRAFRIFPLYYLVLAFTVWQTYYLGGESWDQLKLALPYYLTFMNEQTGAAPWKLTWTLGIEWKFYLIWPILAFWIARSTETRLAVSAATAVLLVAFSEVSWLHAYHYSVLLMGSVLAILLHTRRGFALLSPLMRPSVSFAVAVGFLLFQSQMGDIQSAIGNDGLLANIYGLGVIVLLVSVLGNNISARVLSSAPLVFIGRRSYALYLIQILASQAVTGFMPWREIGLWYFVVIMIAGLIISDVLLRYIEKPAIVLGHKVVSKWKDHVAANSAKLPTSAIQSVPAPNVE